MVVVAPADVSERFQTPNREVGEGERREPPRSNPEGTSLQALYTPLIHYGEGREGREGI